METNSFLGYLLRNQSVDNDRLMEVLTLVAGRDESEVLRLMAYLTGFSDMPKIPETSDVAKNATLVSYNFVSNRVTYSYLRASKLSVSEEYRCMDGRVFEDYYCDELSKMRNSGDFQIEVYYTSTNDCPLNHWIEKSKQTEVK